MKNQGFKKFEYFSRGDFYWLDGVSLSQNKSEICKKLHFKKKTLSVQFAKFWANDTQTSCYFYIRI